MKRKLLNSTIIEESNENQESSNEDIQSDPLFDEQLQIYFAVKKKKLINQKD